MSNETPKRTKFLKDLFINNNDTTYSNEEQHVLDVQALLAYHSSLAMFHSDLIIILTPEAEIVSQNKRDINKLLGYSPRKKLDVKKLVSKASYTLLVSSFKNTLKGNSEKHEIIIEGKDGQILHTILTFIPIKKENGAVEGVYLIIEDITDYKELTKILELNEQHLNHDQQIAKIGNWEYFIDEDKLYGSNYFYEIFGIDEKNNIAIDKPLEVIHKDDYADAYAKLKQAVDTGESYVSTFRIHHGKTKEIKYIKAQAETVWKNDKPYKLVGVFRDITTTSKLEHTLDETDKTLKHVFNNLNVGIWMRESIDGKVIFASKAMEDILQVPLIALFEKPDMWKDMIFPAHHSELSNKFRELKEGKSIKSKYQINAGDGTMKWVLEQAIPRINDEGEISYLFGMITDITSEVAMQDQLEFLAAHDPLTKLPNQRSLYEKLDAICEDETNQFAVLYLDLDRFHIINNSLGYQIGSEVLREIANRIVSTVIDNAYVARLTSNSFVVIIENPRSKDYIFSLAEKIMENLSRILTVSEYELYITISIGICFFPEDGKDKVTLLENAHSALEYAKNKGMNNYQIYSFSGDVSSYQKYMLDKDMRKAIINEDFELYYQPQVNAKNGTIETAEALIRWNHEEWGIVAPDEFIQLAEKNHLIHPIGNWVIKKVCSQLQEWQSNGHKIVPIAINISPFQFLKKGVVDFIKEQLRFYQIPAEYLEFEITEGSLLKDEDNVLSTIADLKELGIKVAIDDFGTGYASLNYLRVFKPDIIKIDKIFIQNNERVNRAIISGILYLAQELNVQVVAEGVEEYEQLTFLKEKDCDLIQGYLFSKPVPADQFEQMLQIGYLKPLKREVNFVPEKDRRSFYRFKLPNLMLGKMKILEVNHKKVDLGSTTILIENISIGGMKMVSSLKLPINSTMKLKLNFTLMNEPFEIEGALVWMNKGRNSIFFYGIQFNLRQADENTLSEIINKITVLRNLDQEIPHTKFIHENASLFLHNSHYN